MYDLCVWRGGAIGRALI